jgi:pilus assembly protein Flp/PilA
MLRRFFADERGATAIEYGLIAALIAVLAIGSMTIFGNSLSGMFGRVANKAGNAMSGG